MVNDVDVRRGGPVGLVDGPVQHRRRQPRGHPAQHRRAQERHQHAGRGARRGRRHPSGRGRHQLAARTACARSTRTCGRTGRACGTSTRRMDADPGRQRAVGRRPDRRTSPAATVLRGSYPWPLIPSVGANPNDQPDVDTPLASRILDPAPCGYFIPQAEYTAPRIGPRPGDFGTGRASAWRSTASRSSRSRRRVRAAQAAAARPDRADPRLGGGAADDRDRPAPLLLPRVTRVGGTVPATLSLTLGAPATFGAFTPGVARTTPRATTANVISTAGDATLSRADPSANARATWSTAGSRCRSRSRSRPTRAPSPRSRRSRRGLQRTGLQRLGDDRLQAVHRRQRRAAHRDLLEDADVHAVDDEPVGLSAGG